MTGSSGNTQNDQPDPNRNRTADILALKAEEERVRDQSRQIIEHNIDGMIVINRDGDIIFANPAACTLLGRDETALIGSPLGVSPVPARAMELNIPRHGDRACTIELRATEIEWDGQPATLCSLRDVTEREALLERQEHLNRVLRSIRDVNQLIVQEADTENLLNRACQALVETRGYRLTWVALLDDNDAIGCGACAGFSGVEDKLALAWARRMPPCVHRAQQAAPLTPVVIENNSEVCVKCPIHVECGRGDAMTCRLGEHGRQRGILTVRLPEQWSADAEEQALFAEVAGDIAFALHDIELTAAHRQAEHELHESEARYRQLVELLREGIWELDTEGCTTFVNPAMTEMLSFSLEEMEGHHLFDFMDKHQVPKAKRQMQTCGSGVNDRTEITFMKKDGTPVDLLLSTGPIYDAEGTRRGTLASVTDMTQIRAAQEKIRAAEAQLRQAQKLESLGTLAGGVAHEINNPINGIMNYAQLIRDRIGLQDATVDEFASEIIHETERVATIVKNLLTFTRHDSHERSPVHIGDIVEDTLSLIRTVLRHDQISLSVDVPGSLPWIRCRSQQIQQVIMNLIVNARDALNEKYPGYDDNKTISITARELSGENGALTDTPSSPRARGSVEASTRQTIRLTVEDHGPGIPDEVRERIFDPFYTTKPRDRGTGLGLSISYNIIRDHGGSFRVETEPGAWTRFCIDLPGDPTTPAN